VSVVTRVLLDHVRDDPTHAGRTSVRPRAMGKLPEIAFVQRFSDHVAAKRLIIPAMDTVIYLSSQRNGSTKADSSGPQIALRHLDY